MFFICVCRFQLLIPWIERDHLISHTAVPPGQLSIMAELDAMFYDGKCYLELMHLPAHKDLERRKRNEQKQKCRVSIQGS